MAHLIGRSPNRAPLYCSAIGTDSGLVNSTNANLMTWEAKRETKGKRWHETKSMTIAIIIKAPPCGLGFITSHTNILNLSTRCEKIHNLVSSKLWRKWHMVRTWTNNMCIMHKEVSLETCPFHTTWKRVWWKTNAKVVSATHCGQRANKIAANACGQLFQVNPRKSASGYVAFHQSYCQIK